MRIEFVSSPKNPKIKDLVSLQEKSSMRRETGLFVVEGRREIEHALESGYKIDTLFYCPELGGIQHPADKLIEVPAAVYEKIAYRGTTEGEIAEFREKIVGLKDIVLGKNPLVVVLESVEKPGNLGAVLRSADAAGADAVIVCDPLTDLYNPNLIRASLGAVFTGQVVSTTSEEAVKWLKNKKIQILTAQLQDSEWYYDTDMKRGTALVIGTESTGLTDIWRNAADAHIKIPMLGSLDSLNASVSAAILLFEAVRQRNA
ncbi:MAG: RNA methyltransferase [Bacteroidales bacterium]|nr:RNA methyltransferase [Bacteroidales bacterium]